MHRMDLTWHSHHSIRSSGTNTTRNWWTILRQPSSAQPVVSGRSKSLSSTNWNKTDIHRRIRQEILPCPVQGGDGFGFGQGETEYHPTLSQRHDDPGQWSQPKVCPLDFKPGPHATKEARLQQRPSTYPAHFWLQTSQCFWFPKLSRLRRIVHLFSQHSDQRSLFRLVSLFKFNWIKVL